MRVVLTTVAALAAGLAWPGSASAYHNADFALTVDRGGGNGMYFTGSPRGKRLDCTACHMGGERSIGIEITSVPAELMADGNYTPGTTYELSVRMTGEHLGDPGDLSGYDNNSFVAEFDDDGGALVGAWSGHDQERIFTMDVAGGDARVASGYAASGGVQWQLSWTAPAAGTGRVTLHLGAVDGNAAGGGVETVVDPFGDDVFVGAWRFCEQGDSCDRSLPEITEKQIDDAHESAAAGCSAAGQGGGIALVALALVFLLGTRRPGALIVCAALALPATGCLDSGGEPSYAPECPGGVCEYTSAGNPFGSNPDLNQPYFRCEVQPILQGRCSNFACHGDADRAFVVYAPYRHRLIPNPAEEPIPTTEAEFAANRAAAQEFSGAAAASSLLLLKPLDVAAGGYYHYGRTLTAASDVFAIEGDIGYQKIANWIDGATASADCQPTQEIGP